MDRRLGASSTNRLRGRSRRARRASGIRVGGVGTGRSAAEQATTERDRLGLWVLMKVSLGQLYVSDGVAAACVVAAGRPRRRLPNHTKLVFPTSCLGCLLSATFSENVELT